MSKSSSATKLMNRGDTTWARQDAFLTHIVLAIMLSETPLGLDACLGYERFYYLSETLRIEEEQLAIGRSRRKEAKEKLPLTSRPSWENIAKNNQQSGFVSGHPPHY